MVINPLCNIHVDSHVRAWQGRKPEQPFTTSAAAGNSLSDWGRAQCGKTQKDQHYCCKCNVYLCSYLNFLTTRKLSSIMCLTFGQLLQKINSATCSYQWHVACMYLEHHGQAAHWCTYPYNKARV